MRSRDRPGMLPAWKLAVVAAVTDTEAKVEWLNQAGDRKSGVLALPPILPGRGRCTTASPGRHPGA